MLYIWIFLICFTFFIFILRIDLTFLRKNARNAISWQRHFRSPKRKNENTLQYKVPPKTWENSPQKPILAIRKWFFGHCYVQKYFFLTRTPTKYLNSYIFWTGSSRRFWKGRTLVWDSQLHLGCLQHHCETFVLNWRVHLKVNFNN